MNRLTNIVALIILLVGGVLTTRAQGNIKFEEYGLEEGLPSNEAYFTYQDSLGYIWIGTDRGLARFDGYRFKTFTTENSGLTYNTIFKVYPAPNGELWFSCFDGSITIYNQQTGKFKPFRHNARLNTYTSYWIKDIIFDQDTVYIQFLDSLDKRGVTTLTQDTLMYRETAYRSWDSLDIQIVYDFTSVPEAAEIDVLSKVYYTYESGVWQVLFPGKYNFFGAAFMAQLDDGIVFSVYDRLYRLVGGKMDLLCWFSQGTDIRHILPDQNNRMIVATNKGLYEVKNGLERRLLDGDFTHVFQDKEGNYWATTTKRGVVRVPFLPLEPNVFRLDNNKMITLEAFDNFLLIGTDKEQLACLDTVEREISIVKKNFIQSSRKSRINGIINNQGKILVSGGVEVEKDGQGLKVSRYFDLKPLSFTPKHASGFFHMYIGHGTALVTTATPSFTYCPDISKGEMIFCDKIDQRITDLDQDNSGSVWLPTLQGSWKLDTANIMQPCIVTGVPALNGRVNQVTHTSGDVIVFATASKGIVLLGNNDTLVLNKASGLVSNEVNCVALENDSILWVGTNRGVNRVRLEGKDLGQSHVTLTLNTDDGLLSNFIHSIEVWNGKLWLGVEEELQSFRLSRFRQIQTVPDMLLQELFVLEEQKGFEQHRFKYFENDISIRYAGLSFRKPVENFYRYRLVYNGESDITDFTFTDNTRVDLFNLIPGDYLFEIACRDKNNNWSETKVFSFTIVPHFTDTLWFKLTIYGGIIVLIILIAMWRIREIRQKNKRETQLRELEYKFKESELAILRNQMNPHFVFNALNSIQSYVLENDMATASGYIQKFSVLMRSSLEYSMDAWISLQDEVNFLKNYLSIEQLRFPDRFTYEISIASDIDVDDVEIPPLLIQPIVENCVKHAFKNSEKPGHIRIVFKRCVGGLECIVEDDGVGVKQSKVTSKVGHRSFGMQVVRNRLELLKSSEFTPSLGVEDISEIDPTKRGTRVKIRMPVE